MSEAQDVPERGKSAINIKKGFRRLAIVTLVPWFALWAIVGTAAYRRLQYADKQLALIHEDKGDGMSDVYLRMSEDASEDFGNALGYGVVWPVIILILFGLGFWIYRGFKPKA